MTLDVVGYVKMSEDVSISKCTLNILLDTRVKGFYPGLEIDGGGIRLDETGFACCHGDGYFELEAKAEVYRCNLKTRLKNIQNLLLKMQKIWGSQGLNELSQKEYHSKTLSWLKDFTSGKETKGLCLTTDVTKHTVDTASELWAIALMAVWRFDVRVHVISLGRTPIEDFFPLEPDADDNRPLICFVEKIDSLWKTDRVTDLETIISWCEKANVPLWAEFLITEEQRKGPVRSKRRSPFSKRMNDLKKRSPEKWLQEDARSRLNSLCHSKAFFQKLSSNH